MLRILQFADIVNRFDFIDTIVKYSNPNHFYVGICVRSPCSNIAVPDYSTKVPYWVLSGVSRKEVPRAIWQLAKILRRWKVDILHAHHYDQAIIGWLATRLHPRTRLVIGRHYSDAIYRSSRGLKRIGLRSRTTGQSGGCADCGSFQADSGLVDRSAANQSSQFTAFPMALCRRVYSSSPIEVSRVRRELQLDGAFALGNFARLHEEKGQRFLIEALAILRDRLPYVRLIVVGEGPERAALEQQIAAAGLADRVQLLGLATGRDYAYGCG